PYLRDSERILQWKNDASGTYLDVVRHSGDGAGEHRGIRVRATERVEMPFGNPYGAKIVDVREAGSVEQQPVQVLPLVLAGVGGEIEEAEVDGARLCLHELRSRRLSLGGPQPGLDDDLVSPAEGPQEFEDGYVEADARHCQPHGLPVSGLGFAPHRSVETRE